MFKCKICDELKQAKDIQGNICYECAEKEYTDRLGIKYLEKNRNCYLDIYGIEKVDKDKREDVIDVLEKDYLSKIDMDGDWNDMLRKLREYILDDMDDWIEFLEEEI